MICYDRDIQSFRIVAEDHNEIKLWCDSVITLQIQVKLVHLILT